SLRPSTRLRPATCSLQPVSQAPAAAGWARADTRAVGVRWMGGGETSTREDWDVLAVGSGFGGAMAAHAVVSAGLRVLMGERGGWVERGPPDWETEGVWELTPYVASAPPCRVLAGGDGELVRPCHCVGGLSVFYGGVSLRLRERDLDPDPVIVGDSRAAWPYRYRSEEHRIRKKGR